MVITRHHKLGSCFSKERLQLFSDLTIGNYSRDFITQILIDRKQLNKTSVLVPYTICSVVIDAILDAGCDPKFYDETKDLSVCLNEVRNLITIDVIAFIIVDYFGCLSWTDNKALLSECENNQTIVINDWAHSFLNLVTKNKQDFIFNANEFLVSSPYKIIGGATGSLSLSSMKFSADKFGFLLFIERVLKNLLKYSLYRWIKLRSKSKGRIGSKRCRRSYFDVNLIAIWKIIFWNRDFQKLIDRRCKNFFRIHEVMAPLLEKHMLSPVLHRNGENGKLLGFSIEITSTPQLQYFNTMLNFKKVDSYIWPDYHNIDGRSKKRSFMVIPITEDCSSIIEKVVECLDI
jgi:hypothetical protein